MRLHLSIQRNGLPPTQILWTVPDPPPQPLASTTTKSLPPPHTTRSSSSRSSSDNTDHITALSTIPASTGIATGGPSTTIAQLLEQVNEVIPLESEDWGLEDYSVEVGGFECLHFQGVGGVGGVLRDGDVVCIRPLQTADLRERKFSGRHQISADGKHLIDGIAFGRPYLKRPVGRPAVGIEPRKRRRGGVDDGGEDGGEVYFGVVEEGGEQQIVVRAGFEDADEEGGGADEDEDEGEDDEGLEDEAQYLQELLRLEQGGLQLYGDQTGRSKRAGLGLNFLMGGEYNNPLLDQYSQDDPLTESSAPKIRNKHEKSNSKGPKSALTPQRVTRAASTGSSKSVRFEEQAEDTMPATEVAMDDDDEDDEDDKDFDPSELEDDSTDINESDKENTEPLEDPIVYNETSDSSSSSDTHTSDSELGDGDDTSSSGTSSSDSDSESETDARKFSNTVKKGAMVNGQSSSSSSISEGNTTANRDKKGKTSNSVTSKTTKPDKSATDPKTKAATQPPVPPGAGKQDTVKRNVRRKVSAALNFHKANGELPEDAAVEDLIALKERTTPSTLWVRRMREHLDSLSTKAVVENPIEFEEQQEDTSPITAKKQKLLESLQLMGGIDVTPMTESTKELVPGVNTEPADEGETVKSKKTEKKKKKKKHVEDEPTLSHSHKDATEGAAASQSVENDSGLVTVQVPDSLQATHQSSTTQPGEAQPLDTPTISPTPADLSASPGSAPSGSQRPRSKLDLASSKRMLFGSLGLKAPKNKDDESALREKLMRDVKPIKPVKERVAEIEAAQAEPISPELDDDSWKEKIRVAAVECCHDGIVYNAPPFPFVQRWDPQQQGTYSKGSGKEKRKRKRKNRQSYEESFQNYESTLEPESPSKVARQESYDANTEQAQFDAIAFEHDQAQQSYEWSHDQNLGDSAAANEQLLRESSQCPAYTIPHPEQDLELEALRSLPALTDDLTKYPELTKEHCSVGAVIAFKKFLMSAQTNWQPGISGYLVAVVTEFYEQETVFLTLAKRDQPKDEARYDEETGERLYSKFEMPGYDDQNAGSELQLPFDMLISPRLIKPSTSKDHSAVNEARISTASDPDDTLVGDEAQRAETEPPAAMSFDSSMDHPSRSDAELSTPFESTVQNIAGEAEDPPGAPSNVSEIGEGLHMDGDSSSFTFKDQHETEAQPARSPSVSLNRSSPPANGEDSATSPLSASAQASSKSNKPEEGNDLWDDDEDPFVQSTRTAVVEYPILPLSHEESESIHNQRQHRSVSLNSEARTTSPDFVSPPPTRREKGHSEGSPTAVSHSRKSDKSQADPINMFDGANDSSDDLPELYSQVFEARMSQDPGVKDESLSYTALHKLPEEPGSGAGSFEQKINEKASQINGGIDFRAEDDANNDSSYRPSQSEVLQSSQIVDLTMSSDPANAQYHESENASSYQSSGGWVEKPNASLNFGKSSSERKTRSRATIAY